MVMLAKGRGILLGRGDFVNLADEQSSIVAEDIFLDVLKHFKFLRNILKP